MLILLLQLVSLNFIKSTKPVGKGQSRNSWKKKTLYLLFAFLVREAKVEKSTQPMWDADKIFYCDVSWTTIFDRVECVLLQF
jgi:hypothetical protein